MSTYVNQEDDDLSRAVIMIQVDFNSCENPILQQCAHSVPQLFSSSGSPFIEANQYLTSASRRLSAKSLITTAEHIKELYLWLQISYLTIQDLSDAIFDNYIDALCIHKKNNGQPLSWNTIQARASGAHRFLIWCFEHNYCPDLSPTETADSVQSARKKYQVKGHPSKKLKDHIKFLLLEDAIRFVNALEHTTGSKDPTVKNRNKLLAEMMLQTGLRISELINFPLKDLPEVNHSGHSTIARVNGKGGKARAILIPNSLLLKLWEYVDYDREGAVDRIEKIVGKVCVEDTLFISSNGQRLTKNWIEKIFQKNSGYLNLKTTPHTLRHTFGTYHYLLNRDLSSLASLMGHEQESTTSTYYVHTATLASYTGTFKSFQEEIDRLIGG